MRRLIVIIAFILLGFVAVGHAAGITKGPYLLALGDRWVVVKWESGSPGGTVEYGFTSGNYEFSVASKVVDGMNEAMLMCLKPGTYFYRVIAGDQTSDEYAFSTGPAPTEAFKFLAFGDTRTGHAIHQTLIYLMENFPAISLVHTGDMVISGALDDEWNTFFSIEKPLAVSLPYIPAAGNHEYIGDSTAYNYGRFFDTDFNRATPLRYAYTIGNSRFIGFDSNTSVAPGAGQYEWISQELDRSSKMPRIKHLFVVIHHPPYNSCEHANEAQVLALQQYIVPLFEAYGVDIVFTGHCHFYERSQSNGVMYVTVGAGGAPLYTCNQNPNPKQVYCESTYNFAYIEVQDEHVHVDAYRIDGSLMDSFDIDNDFGGPGTQGADEPDPCYNFDYDQDGLTDGYEQYESDCLDPYNPDTDGDGWKDGEEVAAGTDPCDPNSHPNENPNENSSKSNEGCGCQF